MAVESILADLGLAETPRILVMNKVDLVPPEEQALLLREGGPLTTVAVSAQDPASTGPLLAAIEAALVRDGRAVRGSEEAPPGGAGDAPAWGDQS